MAQPSLDALITQLDSPRSAERNAAVRALGQVGAQRDDPDARTRIVEALARALDDDSKYVRLEAAFALRRLGVRLEDDELRQLATATLRARLGDQAGHWRHPDVTVAAVARAALRQIEAPAAAARVAAPAPKARRRTVFLSYAHGDGGDLAARLEADLRASGFRVWWDQGIRPGDDWEQAIRQAVDQADALVVVFTPKAAGSRYVRAEWHYALDQRGIAVIPLLAPGFDPADLPLVLRIIQWVDARQDYESALAALIGALQGA